MIKFLHCRANELAWRNGFLEFLKFQTIKRVRLLILRLWVRVTHQRRLHRRQRNVIPTVSEPNHIFCFSFWIYIFGVQALRLLVDYFSVMYF